MSSVLDLVLRKVRYCVAVAWEAALRSRLINDFADLARRHEQHAET